MCPEDELRSQTMSSKRVVITGLGAVTAVGLGVKAFTEAMRD